MLHIASGILANLFASLQLRALGVSTVICTAVGAAAYFAFQQSGINAKPVADVASLHETISLAKHQRVSNIRIQAVLVLHVFASSAYDELSIAQSVSMLQDLVAKEFQKKLYPSEVTHSQ